MQKKGADVNNLIFSACRTHQLIFIFADQNIKTLKNPEYEPGKQT
jgi:hypothetical protein